MNYSAKNRIAIVNANPPTLKRMDDEGMVVTEKLPGIRMVRKFISLSGNTIRVTLADGKSVGSFNDDARPEVTDPDNAGALRKWKRLHDDGALLYSECPYGPDGPLTGKKACDPVRLWSWKNRRANMVEEEQCCKHITEIALKRQAQQTAKTAELATQFTTENEKLQLATLRQLELMNETNAKKAEK